jgi:glucose/arabinose dehydrogenase
MKIRTALVAAVAASLASTALAQVPAVRTKRIASGLYLPTLVTHAPGDTSRLFVVEKRGTIKIIDLTTSPPTVLPTMFLNIDPLVSGGTSLNDEQGMLGMAFHPNYAENGYFFVFYTGPANTVRRYKVSAKNPNVADPNSALTLLSITDPFSNHNGGNMAFGPDGYLYIGTGDGGSGNDPQNNSQNINSKLGKMLRIDPNVAGNSPAYFPVAGNPYAGATPGDDDIVAIGLRNPWRWCFDRETGDMVIADVGQNAWEEVNWIPAGTLAGRNFGWRCTEGTACTGLTGCTCNGSTLTGPIRTYAHNSSGGYSITGGHVYRGCAYPELAGTYFYADYSTNNIWSLRYVNGSIVDFTLRNSQMQTSIDGFTCNQISSFGEDANGEMYIVDHGGTTSGQIFKIIPAAGEAVCPEPCPTDLDGNGSTEAGDLASLLAAWSTPAADIDGNGTTDAGDLAVMLGAWGACP